MPTATPPRDPGTADPVPSVRATGGTGRSTRRPLIAARAALVANMGIVVTGGIVRVTGSGLGCPDWPRCDGRAVAPLPGGEHGGWRAAIEFGNRLLTFVVLAAVVALVIEVRRSRPNPPGLERLAWLLPAGVLLQALLGGVTVLTGLSPTAVAGHFLLSMALIAVAVVLVERLRVPHEVAADPPADADPVGGTLRAAASALVVVAGAVLVLGTIVTGAGPHGGDPSAPRFPVDIRLAAIAHADAVWLLIGLTVIALVVARRLAPGPVARAVALLLGIELAQGGIGYLQYALGVPASVVSLHIVGATVLWAQTVRVRVLAGATR